jgi:1,4-dihydroxy-2-naphthoyl-CoA hydrolase
MVLDLVCNRIQDGVRPQGRTIQVSADWRPVAVLEEEPVSDAFGRVRDTAAPGELVPWPADAEAVPAGSVFDALDIHPTHVGRGWARAEMRLGPQHLNQRGFCQGGVVVTLADAVAGWATYCLVPDGHAFTTLELHSNLMGSAREGDTLVGLARPVHAGRTTAVLSVDVMQRAQEDRPEDARRLTAAFTCTQMIFTRG